MKTKEPRTFDEQLRILESRGISIGSEAERAKALDILQRVGYYKLINGYKDLFLDKNSDEERYKSGTTISEIYALYYFDAELRETLLRFILPIETHVKSLIAYRISLQYGQDNYLQYMNFGSNKNEISKAFSSIHTQIANRQNDPSISHYLNNYGFIPMWVLNNILTLGIISKICSVMKQEDQQFISKQFRLSERELRSFLLYLTDVRNIAAHGNRLYCMRNRKPLIDMPLHQNLKIERSNEEYRFGKRDLFAAIIALRYLCSNNKYKELIDRIKEILNNLQTHLRVLTIDDVLNEMGFPRVGKCCRQK